MHRQSTSAMGPTVLDSLPKVCDKQRPAGPYLTDCFYCFYTMCRLNILGRGI